MWPSKTVASLAKVIGPISRWLHNIGAVILSVMMFLTAADVLGRYVFNRPIPGAFELQEFMMAILVAMAVGYVAFLKRHVVIDIFSRQLPQRVQAGFNVLHHFVGCALFALVCWRTVLEGLALHSRHFTSTVLFIPVTPFYFVVAFGSAVLCIAFFYDLVESLSESLS